MLPWYRLHRQGVELTNDFLKLKTRGDSDQANLTIAGKVSSGRGEVTSIWSLLNPTVVQEPAINQQQTLND